jgi:alpha-mannosidase
MDTIVYSGWPVLEFKMQVFWWETRKMLKLSIPATFQQSSLLCEIPGGKIERPADGEEHVHGRWCLLCDTQKNSHKALALINNGQHGVDCKEGEIRLSILRGASYCHEQGFQLDEFSAPKFMDQGMHFIHLLVTVGEKTELLKKVSGLADWLNNPPSVYAHLPANQDYSQGRLKAQNSISKLLTVIPENVRVLACKQSLDKKAVIIRVHETAGQSCRATICLFSDLEMHISLKAFEFKTVRVNSDNSWTIVDPIQEIEIK